MKYLLTQMQVVGMFLFLMYMVKGYNLTIQETIVCCLSYTCMVIVFSANMLFETLEKVNKNESNKKENK